MAVKSAKKAIEAAGLPTGTLEEAQEGPQEGQGGPGSAGKGRGGGKYPGAGKTPGKAPGGA